MGKLDEMAVRLDELEASIKAGNNDQAAAVAAANNDHHTGAGSGLGAGAGETGGAKGS